MDLFAHSQSLKIGGVIRLKKEYIQNSKDVFYKVTVFTMLLFGKKFDQPSEQSAFEYLH